MFFKCLKLLFVFPLVGFFSIILQDNLCWIMSEHIFMTLSESRKIITFEKILSKILNVSCSADPDVHPMLRLRDFASSGF